MDAYEWRARRLIRFAYPRRFLVHREDELLGVLLDLAEPGAGRLPRRLAWDVLFGGVRFRLRDRPPLRRWLGYRFLDLRLPPRWQAWARDDITNRLWPARRHMVIVAAVVALFGGGDLLCRAAGVDNPVPLDPIFFVVYSGAGLVGSYLTRRRLREGALKRHRLSPEPVHRQAGRPAWRPPPGFTVGPVPSQQLWPALVIPAAAALAAAAAMVALLLARFPGSAERIALTVSVATALGAGLAVPAARRLRRRLVTRPPEPDRPQVCWHRSLLVLTTVAAAATTAAPVIGVGRHAEPDLAPLVPVMLALVLAPGMLVAGLTARAAERRSGLVVTGREMALGVFGEAEVIPPERPTQMPFPPPPT